MRVKLNKHWRRKNNAELREIEAKRIAVEQIAQEDSQHKISLRFLEKENLELMYELKKMRDELSKSNSKSLLLASSGRENEHPNQIR